jgi:tetratricopeptide (TPR) repeat protein
MTRSGRRYSWAVVLLMFLASSNRASQSQGFADSRGSLSGRVSVEGEVAAPQQTRVEIRMMGENLSSAALTDRNGDFRFEGIPAGNYLVSVRVAGCEPYEDGVRVDGPVSSLAIRLRRTGAASLAKDPARSVSVHELSVPPKARKAFDKGNRLAAEHHPEAAIPEYQHAIREFSDFYEAYYKMGVAEIDRGNGNEAKVAFRKALELSEQKFAPALSGLSLVLSVEHRFEEADAAARESVELDATDPTSHYALGLADFAIGRFAESEKESLEALRLKPKFLEAYLLLAQVHARENNPAAVVADLDSYLKLDPDSPRAAKARAVRAGAQNAVLQQVSGSTVADANP